MFLLIISDDIRISVHSNDDHTCLLGDDFPNMKVSDESPLKPWLPSVIEGTQNFTVQIGPTGGKRGYTAITGNHIFLSQLFKLLISM